MIIITHIEKYWYIQSVTSSLPCHLDGVCALYNNYSCIKPFAPLRKTILPAEGQGQRERQREEKAGKRQIGEGDKSERMKGR